MKICRAVLFALVLFFSVAFPAVVQAHWGTWGPVYVGLILNACHRVAPSQRIVQFGTQLYSNSIELSVFPQCTGIDMIRVYSILFGVAMLLNWKRAKRPATLMLYAGGLLIFWAANFCRVVLKALVLYRPTGLNIPIVLGIFVFAAWPLLLHRRGKFLTTSGAGA
jgi:hypothetical protein